MDFKNAIYLFVIFSLLFSMNRKSKFLAKLFVVCILISDRREHFCADGMGYRKKRIEINLTLFICSQLWNMFSISDKKKQTPNRPGWNAFCASQIQIELQRQLLFIIFKCIKAKTLITNIDSLEKWLGKYSENSFELNDISTDLELVWC